MDSKQSNRSFAPQTTNSESPIYWLSRPQYQRQTSFLNPVQETPTPAPTFDSSFSLLNVNAQFLYPDFRDDELSHRPFYDDHTSNHFADVFSSLSLQEVEHDSPALNLRNSDMSSFGFMGLKDSRQQSSNQNGFLPAIPLHKPMVPKNQNVSRSSLNMNRQERVQEQVDRLSFGDLRGNFEALAKGQYGCRFLQRAMNCIGKEEIDMIFLELIEHVSELVTDPFANYVVQKLIEICSEEQRTQILLMLTKIDFQLIRISLNTHGTRAVQKLLEHLTTPQQISLVTAALSAGVVALTKDTSGQHVIQHCLKYFSDEDNVYLLNEVANNCYDIATDRSGCCVLQNCVEYSKGAQRQRLVAEIIANALLLAEDRYGNYVVQHLLGLRVPQITANLVRQLVGHYTALSCNKYGSNVVEKCLIESGESQSMRIVVELLRSPNVSMLLTDPYGNYVIQSALLVSKGYVQHNGFVHEALRNLVRMNAPMMRSNIYGKKVLAWFDRRKLIHL